MVEIDEEINLDNVVALDDQIEGVEVGKGANGLLEALDAYLSTPRFDGDPCIILNMPENIIKRNKEKVNSAVWFVYNKIKGSGVGMMDILIAMETMVDASKLAVILDNDIKLAVAGERQITISEDELEYIAATASKSKKLAKQKTDDDGDDLEIGDESAAAPVEPDDIEDDDLSDDDFGDVDESIANQIMEGLEHE